MKKRFIACVLACAVLLMGVGYAFYTDKITVTNNVDTGYLDVKFIDAKFISDKSNWDPKGVSKDSLRSVNPTVAGVNANGTDGVTLNFDNLYPGYYQTFKVKIDNFGTMAAKLGRIERRFNTNFTEAMRPEFGIAINCFKVYDNVTQCGFIKFVDNQFSVMNDKPTDLEAWFTDTNKFFWIDGQPFLRLSALSTLSNEGFFDNFDATEFLYLDVTRKGMFGSTTTYDSEMSFEISIGMDPDAAGKYTTGATWVSNPVGTDELTENKSGLELYLDFKWNQYNAAK